MRQKGLLLDRDGVINEDQGYVGSRDRFVFRPGLFDFLRQAQDLGYRLAIVTNQSGIARGYYTAVDHEALTAWMLGELRREGVSLDLVLSCYEHAEGNVAPYNRASYWRKPNPGMILEAALRLDLDLSRSAMLGDKDSDMQAAQAAGVGTCLYIGKKVCSLPGVQMVADFTAALSTLTQR